MSLNCGTILLNSEQVNPPYFTTCGRGTANPSTSQFLPVSFFAVKGFKWEKADSIVHKKDADWRLYWNYSFSNNHPK